MIITIKQTIDVIATEVLVAPVDDDFLLTSISWDSREVQKNSAFLAIKGERVDGNDFLISTIQSGARLLIASDNPTEEVIRSAKDNGVALIIVADPEIALQKLAIFYRTTLHAKVVGITGSSGKTTTKDLLSSILAQSFKTVATKINQNNELGVPRTVLNADPCTETLIVEMGMRGLGQIQQSSEIAKPDIGVITNIGVAHEELLGSRKNIAIAKAEILEALPDKHGIAILNGGDDFTDFISEYACLKDRGIEIVSYGMDSKFDVYADNIVMCKDGTCNFILNTKWSAPMKVKLKLQGKHNVLNALAAAAVGIKMGMVPEKIAYGLNLVGASNSRQEIHVLRDSIVLMDDSYNANPDSMRAALDSLFELTITSSGKRIAILGDMGELGKNSRRYHEDIGRYSVQKADVVIAIGNLATSIVEGAKMQMAEDDKSKLNPNARILYGKNAGEAFKLLTENVSSGDNILVKASRAMKLDLLAAKIIEEYKIIC